MKKTLLLLFAIAALSHARASDTLTVRQVYNFNVGDTFDYKIYAASILSIFNETYLSNYNFARYVISYKYLSGDTLIYYKTQIYPSYQIDTLVYTSLDSPITSTDTCLGCLWNFSTGILINDSLYNEIDMGTGLGESGANNIYAGGLGAIYSDTWFTYPPTDYSSDSTILIYYSSAGRHFGVPYTIANDTSLLHYTPIPEECAVWTKQAFYYYGNYSLYEQIRTGTKYYLNSHTYVELIYRSYDSYLNAFTNDSLIGYFRNDTANRKVLFRDSLNGADTILYDFSLVSGNTIPSNFAYTINTVTLDTIIIGGQSRDIWSYRDVECCYTSYNRSYAEGIGGLQGFLINKFPIALGNYQPDIGSLISFCVCGENLYPDTAAGACQLLTGIPTINQNESIHLYPNPANDEVHLTISNISSGSYQFIMTDILGQQVYAVPVTQSESTFDISGLAAGMYTWRVASGGSIIKAGKVVKE